jgi:S-(hydroxymethyl)glutathione dehydrogenase/alcohol dehydrogenase
MTHETHAAVVKSPGGDLDVESFAVPDPGPTQVLVRIHASGICRTDESVRQGRVPWPLPAVLGHEGAGTVEAVGDEVADVAPGDRVVCLAAPSCGRCFFCLRGQWELCARQPEMYANSAFHGHGEEDGGKVAGLAGLGTFSELITVDHHQAVKTESELPFEQLAVIGCGFKTGVGAVLNTARVVAGETVAVVGCGGVGLAMVQAARLSGAGRIVAVDPQKSKRRAATGFGATDAVDPSAGDPVEQVQELTGGMGVDVALEAVGLGSTLTQAYRMTRRGGRVVPVGEGGTDEVSLTTTEMVMSAREILPCYDGGGPAARDVARTIALVEAGPLSLEGVISQTLPLDEIERGFEALRGGETVRSVVVFP